MKDMALRRRIATLVMAAFLSVMGATTAMMAVSDDADAARPNPCPNCHDNPPKPPPTDGGTP
jgi:hypothetical protein